MLLNGGGGGAALCVEIHLRGAGVLSRWQNVQHPAFCADGAYDPLLLVDSPVQLAGAAAAGVGGGAAAADLFELLQAAGVGYAPPLLVGSTFYFSILLLCEEGLLNAIQRDPNPFAYLCKFEKL